MTVNNGTFTLVVTVTNTTAKDAQLVGWIDFDANEILNDTDERSLPALVGVQQRRRRRNIHHRQHSGEQWYDDRYASVERSASD